MHSKNEKIILKIEDITPEGSGVGRAEDGYVLFVPGTAPGDTAGCTVLKAGRSYGYAKADSIIDPSPYRTDPGCGAFGRCGGCALRHIGYDYELEIKGRWIAESFRRIGGFDIGKVNVRAASSPDRYRNKAEYPAGTDREGRLRFGLYAPRSHRVVACTDCLLVPGFHRKIIAAAEDFCNSRGFSAYEDGKGGLIRHLYIRDARATGQTSVSLIVNGRELPDREGFAAAVREALPEVTSVSVIYNEKPGNVILGDRYETVYGSERITDRLSGLDFEISPLSFYQVNRDGAELLYGIAGEMLGECPGTLIDLYCGIGTVGLSLAGRAGRLIGVEIIPQAVDDARRNAALNGTDNAEFICGDAAAAAEKLAGEGIEPSAVVIDPPRKGCAPSVIADIIKMSPEKIVMISCNHATGARDAALLCAGGYRLERIEGVDMFPRTGHVETVCLLSNTQRKKKEFMELMDLAKSMSEEEQRFAREGFSNDEELSIYDLLFSDNLSKSDIDKIKKMSVELLKKIKERIAGMDHWTDKQETRAAVDVLIRNVLYEQIPDSMFDRLEAYRKAIYEHIYTHYKEAA